MRKLKMSLISLMGISLILSSCYDPKGKKIYRLDLKANECRVYIAAESKPELIFEHFETLPAENCDGIWGVDTKHMGKIVAEWNAHQAKEDAKKEKR